MPLCQLIHKEIQKISGTQIDTNYLDPREYDKVMEQIPKEIEKLKILQKLVSLSSESLAKIDKFWLKTGLDVRNIELKDLFASRAEDISEKTIFFEGDLSFKDFQKTNPDSTQLPQHLKFIFGKFDATETNIESADLEYVEQVSLFNECLNLTKINIGSTGGIVVQICDLLLSINIKESLGEVYVKQNKALQTMSIGEIYAVLNVEGNIELINLIFGNVADTVYIQECDKLASVTMGHVTGNLAICKCDNIKLENINSHTGGKIVINQNFVRRGSGLGEYTDQEISTKFDIRHNAF